MLGVSEALEEGGVGALKDLGKNVHNTDERQDIKIWVGKEKGRENQKYEMTLKNYYFFFFK